MLKGKYYYDKNLSAIVQVRNEQVLCIADFGKNEQPDCDMVGMLMSQADTLHTALKNLTELVKRDRPYSIEVMEAVDLLNDLAKESFEVAP